MKKLLLISLLMVASIHSGRNEGTSVLGLMFRTVQRSAVGLLAVCGASAAAAVDQCIGKQASGVSCIGMASSQDGFCSGVYSLYDEGYRCTGSFAYQNGFTCQGVTTKYYEESMCDGKMIYNETSLCNGVWTDNGHSGSCNQ